MKILNSLADLQGPFAVTIGNFDGVHMGHRYLLEQIKKDCDKHNIPFAVMVFVPHPLFVLRGKTRLLINSYEERQELLREIGVDNLIEISFNRDFSNQSPQDFLEKILFVNKEIRRVFLGHDFVFGANKSGSMLDIRNYIAHKSDLEIKEADIVTLDEKLADGIRVSSSEIRVLLQDGKIELANRFLARNFSIKGRVIKGHGRGKTIGFPTANVSFSEERIYPKLGVYATRTYIDGLPYISVTNIGRNPTFGTDDSVHIETHIIDFDRDIYGEELNVEFFTHLRLEKKFEHVKALVDQICLDVDKVKKYFHYGK